MKDILSGFGPDSSQPQQPRATGGGPTSARDVMGYQPPVGPIGINRVGVGLGGHNCGPAGSQGQTTFRSDGGAGAPGIVRLGGENEGNGTNE